jgi:predicted enzyme related to lactoylglutathione lyase
MAEDGPQEPIVGVTLDCHDPDGLASFWCNALGFEQRPHPPEATWRTIRRRDGIDGLNHMHFQLVPEGKAGKNRMHLDLFFTDAEAEIERLVSLGATVVGEPTGSAYSQRNTVMRDPEGNEFCIVHRVRAD